MFAVAASLLPLAVLGYLVLGTRVRLPAAAPLSTVVALLLAAWPLGLERAGFPSALGKGVWTGLWILLIVVPALALYEVLERSGALARLSDGLTRLAPEGRDVLLVGWVLPSFLQGAAGFGTPIAITAPMLVRRGYSPVMAVATCLVGYHWAVTFGSMGSSFFIAAGTAGLGDAATSSFAVRVGIVLVANAILAGLLVLRRSPRGLRDAGLVVIVGVAMGAALLATVPLQPALGSTVAGLVGLGVGMFLFGRGAERRRDVATIVRAASPYLALVALISLAFGVPALRSLVGQVPTLAPSFPVTTAGFGHVNHAVTAHNPLRPLLHPGPYLVVGAALGAVLFRRFGWWRPGLGRETLAGWWRRSRGVIVAIPALTALAAVMVEAGMVTALAEALVRALGLVYLAIAAVVGTFGTVITGSTSASNALFAPLQAQAANGLDLPVPLLLAAQAAGGNVGNILSPVNILVGAVAAGCAGREGDVIREAGPDALLLIVSVIAVVTAQWLLL
ncbi:MAG: L-lactate permease [Nitriliruptorales bacterium]